MNKIVTPIADLFVLEPKVFGDSRGYFMETFNAQVFNKLGLDYHFVQDNESYSTYGTLRGLHFQKGSFAQAKLVRVISGEILDVAVDLRKDSATFGKSFSARLSGENKKQMLVPRGFAHGFSVLSPTCQVIYKCDNLYSPENESGIHFTDPDLKIDWLVPREKIVVSDKDNRNKFFREIRDQL
jgi:dTDP-4-dehydrorhamnose 3,5-epimerase